MKFEKLHESIPYVNGGVKKVLHTSPYPYIKLLMPGRHAAQTVPEGGDFVVCITDSSIGWDEHQFSHTELFMDLDLKAKAEPDATDCLMGAYLEIVKNGLDPIKLIVPGGHRFPGIDYHILLPALQCLAVAEHRRYAQHEANWGGRYLPFRFAAGIAEQLWTTTDAADKQKYGKPGVQQLERKFGVPSLTRKLMA